MKHFRRTAIGGLFSLLLLTGCTFLSQTNQVPTLKGLKPGDLATNAQNTASNADDLDCKIANPPAKEIRLDGSEILLGTADLPSIETNEFCDNLRLLLGQQKRFTASRLVHQHPNVAEQALWERYTNTTTDPVVVFIADVLSKNVQPEISWNGLLDTLHTQVADGSLYHQIRSDFSNVLLSEEPSEEAAEQLRTVAMRLNHPLVMVDALRLTGFGELFAERHTRARMLFSQAAEISEQYGDAARAAESWLMAATTANRATLTDDAGDAWTRAVEQQFLVLASSDRPLNVPFWTRADQQRPSAVGWPMETSERLVKYCQSVGCEFSHASPAELALWCAIASTQYEHAQPQLALVNFKKAETFAAGESVMWLRIAESKCLAALGQSQAASALLSVPAASENLGIATAATAAIGTAKLRGGAYQQGAQLISKALSESNGVAWPTRDRSEADLALALLIIGDTDEGLLALHTLQAKLEQQGDFVSLLQTLENEQRILELEGRTDAVKEVQSRINAIENV